MGYLEKNHRSGGPSIPEARQQSRHILWLLPIILLVPTIGRIAKALGVKANPQIILFATITMGVVCVVAAIISYRSAKTMVARDLAELANPLRR